MEDHSIAEKLARNQMEYVYTQPYVAPGGDYETLDEASTVTYNVDPGYTVTAQALTYTKPIVTDTDIARVVVTITRGTKTILVLETLRTNTP